VTRRKWFGKWDVWIFAGLIVPALILWGIAARRDSAVAARGQISVGGQVVQTVDLSRDGEVSLTGNPHIRFAVKDRAVAFIASDCPDKLCIHSGYLATPGQMAACLPNRVSLTVLAPDGGNGVDAVAN